MPKRLTLGLGPPSGVSIGRLSGVGALWDCVSRACGGGGGCAGGGVPLGAGPCCPDVGRCLSGVNIIIKVESHSGVSARSWGGGGRGGGVHRYRRELLLLRS